MVSNNVGAFTWSSDWPSNNTFPLGATVVTYTVTDEAGNMDTCILTVTVLGKCMRNVKLLQVMGSIPSWATCQINLD